MARLYEHVPHSHIARRKRQGPIRVHDQLPRGNLVTRFNAWLAVKITQAVGSMWCAYAFGLFDLISLPAAIHAGTAAIISWVAQTFLQLVLLSIIMVGQNIAALATDKRAEQTFKDAESILAECLKLQDHLQVQDGILQQLIAEQKSASPRTP